MTFQEALSRPMSALRHIARPAFVIAVTIATVALMAPAAHAGPETCWNGSFYANLKVNKRLQFDEHLSYGANYHWCGRNGIVTKFFVDTTWGNEVGVRVDIRPVHPLVWGPYYDIMINASKGTSSDHSEFSLAGTGPKT